MFLNTFSLLSAGAPHAYPKVTTRVLLPEWGPKSGVIRFIGVRREILDHIEGIGAMYQQRDTPVNYPTLQRPQPTATVNQEGRQANAEALGGVWIEDLAEVVAMTATSLRSLNGRSAPPSIFGYKRSNAKCARWRQLCGKGGPPGYSSSQLTLGAEAVLELRLARLEQKLQLEREATAKQRGEVE